MKTLRMSNPARLHEQVLLHRFRTRNDLSERRIEPSFLIV